ncbi:uncharacterized protein LOC135817965 [Sycon ciliatum]|uniref:uncharacterized protein LOC135817965 n=1 Tax=Sycon ciliatum TaxID=27933 RepID=UPI0031F6EC24
MDQTEFVWDPERDGQARSATTSKEVEVWATGILCELEQISQKYHIDVNDMSHLLKLVTSSLKELDVVLEESGNSGAENTKLHTEIGQLEQRLRAEQDSNRNTQRSLLSLQDQHDSERRVLESTVKGLEVRNNQTSDMLAAKAQHYTRLMEELDDMQHQHMEERSRHAMTVRGYVQRIDAVERKLDEYQMSFGSLATPHMSASSMDTSVLLVQRHASRISAASLQEPVLHSARHKQQQQQTKEEDTSPALDSPEREISADSGGSTAPMIGTLSDTSSQCSNEDDRRSICSNGSRSSDHLDQTMAVDVCTTPSATQSSHSTDDDHHSKSPTLHDDWSTRTRRDSQQSIITHHLHSSQRTPLVATNGEVIDGQNLQDELVQANSAMDSTFSSTLSQVYSENAACMEALEARLATTLDERATLIREKSDLQLSLANTASDLSCCRQELETQQQLVAALHKSLDTAKRNLTEAEEKRHSVKSPITHAVVPDASVQLKKDAERLMRLYSFYRDKCTMLQEQLSRMHMARAAGDGGVWRLFGKLFPFRKREAGSGQTSPAKSTSNHSMHSGRHGTISDSGSQQRASDSATARRSMRRSRRPSAEPNAFALDFPCTVGCPPTRDVVTTHGDWYIAKSTPTDVLRFLPACVGQTALLVPSMSTICGFATTLSHGRSSTMPVSNRKKEDLLSSLEHYCDSTVEAELYRQLWVASYENKSQIEIFDVFSKGSLRHTGKSCPLDAQDSVYPIATIKFVQTARISSVRTPRRHRRLSVSVSVGENTTGRHPPAGSAPVTPRGAKPALGSRYSAFDDASSVSAALKSPLSCPPSNAKRPVRPTRSTTSNTSWDVLSSTGLGRDGDDAAMEESGVDDSQRRRGSSSLFVPVAEEISTMWIALSVEGGVILLYNTEATLLERLHMESRGSILCVYNAFNRVFVGLSDCTVAAFDQSDDDASGWNLHLWQSTALECVDEGDRVYLSSWHGSSNTMCMASVHEQLWCTCGRTVVIMDPLALRIVSSFRITFPPVSQLISVGNIVIFGSHLSPFILFYHSATCQLLQDFDLPGLAQLVDSTPSPLLGVASMAVSGTSLWVGCSNGVLLSLPLHATHRVLKQADDSSFADTWQGQSGVVSYTSAKVSHWCHMGPVVGLSPVTVPKQGTSPASTYEVVYSCGIGTLDMRGAEADELIERKRILVSADPLQQLPSIANDPLNAFQQQGENAKERTASDGDSNHIAIMTWRTTG